MPANSRWDLIRGFKGLIFTSERLLLSLVRKVLVMSCHEKYHRDFRHAFTHRRAKERCNPLTTVKTTAQYLRLFSTCLPNVSTKYTGLLVYVFSTKGDTFCIFMRFKPLKTRRRLLYLKTQSVPRCKHFSSRL